MSKEPRHQHPMGGQDAAWWRMESSTNLMIVNALLDFDEELSYDELCELVRQRLLPIPKFTQRVVTQSNGVITRPHWETDPHFELDAHVNHIAIPRPRGDDDRDAALKRVLSDLFSQPLDQSKPLWKIYLLDTDKPGSSVAIRIHHSLADGFALLFLMTHLVDPGEPIHFPMGSVNTVAPAEEDLDEEAKKIARSVRQRRGLPGLSDIEQLAALGKPRAVRSAARQASSASAVAGQLLLMSTEQRSSLRSQLGTIKLVDWSRPVPVDTIKEIARDFGGTINDVLLLALCDSLREVLAGRDESLRPDSDLRCVMPVNLKPLDERGDDLGNGFGLVFIDLPVGFDDPHERLEILKKRLDRLKKSPEAYVTFGVLGAMGMGPASAQASLTKLFYNKASLIATNVPGPIEPVSFGGQEIRGMRFWVPQSLDVGLGFSIFSYCGEVQVGVHVDRKIMPDTTEWVEAFHRALEALRVA